MTALVRRATAGYILLEATVALVVLSIGTLAIHRTIQQAIVTRGQAQDYTQARFLLEKVIADVAMQPEVVTGKWPVTFEGPTARFRANYEIRRVDPPLPAPSVENPNVRYQYTWLAHVRATVTWKRAGDEFSETMETLLASRKLWQPPEGP